MQMFAENRNDIPVKALERVMIWQSTTVAVFLLVNQEIVWKR